jgi:hypothetical protein
VAAPLNDGHFQLAAKERLGLRENVTFTLGQIGHWKVARRIPPRSRFLRLTVGRGKICLGPSDNLRLNCYSYSQFSGPPLHLWGSVVQVMRGRTMLLLASFSLSLSLSLPLSLSLFLSLSLSHPGLVNLTISVAGSVSIRH